MAISRFCHNMVPPYVGWCYKSPNVHPQRLLIVKQIFADRMILTSQVPHLFLDFMREALFSTEMFGLFGWFPCRNYFNVNSWCVLRLTSRYELGICSVGSGIKQCKADKFIGRCDVTPSHQQQTKQPPNSHDVSGRKESCCGDAFFSRLHAGVER